MKKPAKSKTAARKNKGPSPKLLAHLKRLNMSRRKKPAAKKAKPAAKKQRKAPAQKPAAPAPAPAPTPIPPVELPKGDHPGQTVMPVVEAAVAAQLQPAPATPEPAAAPAAKAPGEELL